MKAHRAFCYKLAPTPEQECLIRQFAGVTRLVYNLALVQRRDWWRQFKNQTGSNLNYVAQAKDLTALRAEFAWIAAVSQTAQQQALRDLDKAYANFFAGRAGYPKPRKRGAHNSFRFQGREVEVRKLNRKWAEVRLPKIGKVKFRLTRPVSRKILNATVMHTALGWHIALACEMELPEPQARGLAAVGIDRGVANTLAFSTGEMMSLPDSFHLLDKKKRRAQKVMSRRRRGSKRHAKAMRRVKGHAAKAARIRKDWHHKAALDLSRRFGAVVLEDLKIRNMTGSARGTLVEPGRNVSAKAGLNRSILEQGWHAFETILAYKMEERGGVIVKINPVYTSQTCSHCDTKDRHNRKNQAEFVCRSCGFEAHADHNAALNILRRWNTPLLSVEACGYAACEAETSLKAA